VPKVTADGFVIGFVALVAIWALVGLPFIYWPESPQQRWQYPSTSQQSSNTEPKGTSEAPIFVQVISGLKSAEERAQEAEDREEKKSADAWLVRWTASLFFATIGLILATGVLGYFAFRQMRDMKASILAAERSAKAASDQVSLTRQAMIHTQRAFVFVKEIADSAVTANLGVRLSGPATERTIGWRISIRWENSGETPTKHMLTYVSGKTFDELLPEDFSFDDIPGQKSTPTVLGPKAGIAMGDAIIPLEIMTKIHAGTTHFYVWGWADYDDVFDGTDRHRTEFCYKIEFIGGGALFPVGARMTYRLHDKHNGAEDECMKKPPPYIRPT
jgi:hypothetical protein